MTEARIEIREATYDDVDVIHSFLQPFVRQEFLLPRDKKDLMVLLQHGFVAESTLGIHGFAAVEIYSRKLAEVQSLAVDPNCQGQGIGKQLVAACVQRARREQVLELMAISNSDHFFQQCGFDYSLPNQKRAFFYHPIVDQD